MHDWDSFTIWNSCRYSLIIVKKRALNFLCPTIKITNSILLKGVMIRRVQELLVSWNFSGNSGTFKLGLILKHYSDTNLLFQQRRGSYQAKTTSCRMRRDYHSIHPKTTDLVLVEDRTLGEDQKWKMGGKPKVSMVTSYGGMCSSYVTLT